MSSLFSVLPVSPLRTYLTAADIYTIEIQMAMNAKDRKKTIDINQKALQLARDNKGILNSVRALFSSYLRALSLSLSSLLSLSISLSLASLLLCGGC
jgi:hypothetical protein